MNVYPFSISQGTIKPSTGFINTPQQSFPTKSSAWQPVADIDRVLFAAEILEICAGVVDVLHLQAVPLYVTSQHLYITQSWTDIAETNTHTAQLHSFNSVGQLAFNENESLWCYKKFSEICRNLS